MKKYKLIKTYPGSPKLSTEIIETQINSLCPVNECYINRKTFMLIGYDSFEIKNPENYPEFWEKVVEKDYEILCIKHKKSKCFYRNSIDLRNLNLYDIHSVKRLSDGKAPFTSLEEINRYPKVYEIHSIKRLSDGEV